MLMLCNVDDPKFTRLNGIVFAVFKQVSWGSTWAISSGIYNRSGFFAVVVNSFVMLIAMCILALISTVVDPFGEGQMQSLTDEVEEASDNVKPKTDPEDSEHGTECSPPRNEVVQVIDQGSPNLTPLSGSEVSVGSAGFEVSVQSVASEVSEAAAAASLDAPVQKSMAYCVLVMMLTGGFTFEAAVHSTGLELLLQKEWHFR